MNKRQLLIALAAIGAGGADAALAPDTLAQDAVVSGGCTPLDLSTGRDIGAAWRAAHPDADLPALRADLFPQGVCEEALEALAERVHGDFRDGAIFIYRGWRLAETEARLFALVADD